MENSLVESTTPVYTLSTTSTLSGIPVHSIRQYIDKRLIIPFKKESNRNLFSQVDILRLKVIHKLLEEDAAAERQNGIIKLEIPQKPLSKQSLSKTWRNPGE